MPEGQAVENNSATAVAEPAASGQSAPASVETLEGQSGQANPQGASASVEDTFSSVDPKTLPPELQAIYKGLQADYTKKMQSHAETRKKAEQFEQISKDQRFVDYWSGLNKAQKTEFKEEKAEVEKKLGEKISDEDFAKAFNSKDDFLSLLERVVQDRSEKAQKKIDSLEQKLSIKDASDAVESFATEIGKDGKPVRPDFYPLDEDNLITGYLQLTVDPAKGISPSEYRTKLEEAYQFAKNVTQKYYEKGRTEALQIIQKKAAASTEPPTNAAKGAYTGPDPKKMTVREAMEMAKKGIRVPRED